MKINHIRHSNKDELIENIKEILSSMLDTDYSFVEYVIACRTIFDDMLFQDVVADYELSLADPLIYVSLESESGETMQFKI